MITKRFVEIELGGKKRKAWLGIGFLGMFLESAGLKLSEYEDALADNPFKMIPQMIFHSLEYGYKRENIEPDFNKFDVSDWIADAGGIGGEPVIAFLGALRESLTKGVPQEKVDPETRKGAKKKK